MEENKNQKKDLLRGYFRGYKREIDDTPKKEAEIQYESASDRKKYNSNNLVVVIIMVAVVATSAILLWVMYSVIHVSHLSELAGIHLTKDFQQTASEIINKDKEVYVLAGYEGWQDYKNNVFELKYPPEWISEEKDNEVIIRKFNKKTYRYFDSLALLIVIKQLENPNNFGTLEYLKANKLPQGTKKEAELGEKAAIRTGVFKNAQGLAQEIIYWPLSDKIMKLDVTFYNSNYDELLGDFEKMTQSIKFL